MKLTLLYRGPLASCNYNCDYCPFAKRHDDREALEQDRQALLRLSDWLALQTSHRITLFFTPWGEALVRPWYREAIVRLSHADSIDKIVVQTNLSAPMGWVTDCDTSRLRIWATFHPGECRRDKFVAACKTLLAQGVRMSVGVVGVDAQREEIAALRRELPQEIYLWVNAHDDEPARYDEAAREWYAQIDPLFSVTCREMRVQECHARRGTACSA